MASMSVFCHPSELAGWWDMLCSRRGMGTISFPFYLIAKDENGVAAPLTAADLVAGKVARVFGFPATSPPRHKRLTLDAVNLREWGWVDLQPGRILTEAARSVLTLTALHAEDFPAFKAYPAKHLRWLRRGSRTS